MRVVALTMLPASAPRVLNRGTAAPCAPATTGPRAEESRTRRTNRRALDSTKPGSTNCILKMWTIDPCAVSTWHASSCTSALPECARIAAATTSTVCWFGGSVEAAVINSAPALALTPQAGAGTDGTLLPM